MPSETPLDKTCYDWRAFLKIFLIFFFKFELPHHYKNIPLQKGKGVWMYNKNEGGGKEVHICENLHVKRHTKTAFPPT